MIQRMIFIFAFLSVLILPVFAMEIDAENIPLEQLMAQIHIIPFLHPVNNDAAPGCVPEETLPSRVEMNQDDREEDTMEEDDDPAHAGQRRKKISLLNKIKYKKPRKNNHACKSIFCNNDWR